MGLKHSAELSRPQSCLCSALPPIFSLLHLSFSVSVMEHLSSWSLEPFSPSERDKGDGIRLFSETLEFRGEV